MMNMFVLLYLFFLWLFILIARVDSKFYCRQSIAKFDIKTEVVVYELVKQLSLIIVADLRY